MLAKRARGYASDELQPDTRLRANLVDVFSSNELSAARARSIMQDSGRRGVGNMRRLGSDLNLTRNSQLCLIQKSLWPKEYVVAIAAWSRMRKVASRGTALCFCLTRV